MVNIYVIDDVDPPKKIKPTLRKDDFGRPLGVSSTNPKLRYVWLDAQPGCDEGWYFIDNNEGEPSYWVNAITDTDNVNWRAESKSKWED